MAPERLLSVDAASSPFGGVKAFPIRLTGREALSTLYHFDVTILIDDKAITPEKTLGQNLTIVIAATEEAGPRKISGVVKAMRALGLQYAGYYSYEFELAPSMWFTTLSEDCRIFQEMTVDDIVAEILSEHNIAFKFDTKKTRKPREYCVQYHETDFEFITRLLAEEGCFYFHRHGDSNGRFQHELIIADSKSSYFPGKEGSLEFRKDDFENSVIETWREEHRAHSSEWKLIEYDPEKPTSPLMVNAPSAARARMVSGTERFRAHGRYVDRDRGTKLCEFELDRDEALTRTYRGVGRYAHFEPGAKARFESPPEGVERGEVVVVAVSHDARDYSSVAGLKDATLSAEDDDRATDYYKNDFTCILSDTLFIPDIDRRSHQMRGLQSAVVVGPVGDEIYCDALGRIKVHFHWDRKGKGKANPTCWLRVAQMFAGAKFGAHYVPRIGMEVLVDFLEGDQDRPVVVGAVYNGDNQPPYPLPDDQTKSGWKTISSKDGDLDQRYNEIRFEDKFAEEEIWMHASKDFNREIRNNESLLLHNKREETIKAVDEAEGVADKLTVEQGAKQLEVTKGAYRKKIRDDYETNVEIGHMMTTIDEGNMTTKIAGGAYTMNLLKDHETTIAQGNHSLDVSVGGSTTNAMNKIVLSSKTGIELKVGASSIVIDHSGITLNAPTITSSAQISGEFNGGAMTTIKGGIVMIN